MQKLNLEQMENIEGGTFWGTGCDYSTPIGSPQLYYVGDGTHVQEFCEYKCYYYVFGINTGQNGTTLGACPSVQIRDL